MCVYVCVFKKWICLYMSTCLYIFESLVRFPRAKTPRGRFVCKKFIKECLEIGERKKLKLKCNCEKYLS